MPISALLRETEPNMGPVDEHPSSVWLRIGCGKRSETIIRGTEAQERIETIWAMAYLLLDNFLLEDFSKTWSGWGWGVGMDLASQREDIF